MTKASRDIIKRSWANVHADSAQLGEDGPSGQVILDSFFGEKPRNILNFLHFNDYLAYRVHDSGNKINPQATESVCLSTFSVVFGCFLVCCFFSHSLFKVYKPGTSVQVYLTVASTPHVTFIWRSKTIWKPNLPDKELILNFSTTENK